jgi:hypothetical protein
VGLERGPLNLVTTIEELLGRNSSGSGLENREYVLGIRCNDHATLLYQQKLALTSSTSDGRSVGIVRSRTKATELLILPQAVYEGKKEEEELCVLIQSEELNVKTVK